MPPARRIRRAILYLPPIHHEQPERELETIGQKIAVALDMHGIRGEPRYRAEAEQTLLAGQKVTRCRLLRQQGNEDAAAETIAHLFKFDYRPELLSWQHERGAPTRFLIALLSFVVAFAVVVWRWMRPGHKVKTVAQRAQTVYAFACLALLGGYLALLILTAYLTLTQGAAAAVFARPAGTNTVAAAAPVTVDAATKNADAEQWGAFFERWLVDLPQQTANQAGAARIFVVLAFLGAAFGPAFTRQAAAMTRSTIAMCFYLSLGFKKPQLLGALDQWVEQIMESEQYDECVVLAYSFGTVLAFDALFPPSEIRAARLSEIRTLVTVGSPHDLILTYWPRYFDKRSASHRPPANWINVFLPADLLSTRFLDRKTESTPLPHLPNREAAFREGYGDEALGLLGWITLLGLRAHTMYWSNDNERERNSLGLVIADLFPEECHPSAGTDKGSTTAKT